MLAAQCVCSLLQAEHAVIRQTLATLDEMLQVQAWWQPAGSLPRMRSLMAFLRSFEDTNHLPKERGHLLPAMRGRSADADRLIATLEDARGHTSRLLRQATHVADSVAEGDVRRAGELSALLREHRAALLRQLHDEDTQLLAMARQLLGDEEWSRIASAMSRMPAHPGTPVDGLARKDETGLDEALWQRVAARGGRGRSSELRLR